MYNSKAKLIDFRRLVVFGLILACFTEVIVAQTFNYSRGWTNGKRRSPMTSALGDREREPESFEVWQMERLRRLLELSLCWERILPRESPERLEDDSNRMKRSVGFDMMSYLNALPRAKM